MADNKKILIVSGSILLGTLIAVLVGKAIYKKVVAKKEEKAEVDLDEDVASGSSSDDASDYNPSSNVSTLGGYIYGNNFWTYEDEVDAIIIPLSDARLKKLAEAYKKKYKIGLYKNLIGECCYGMYEESEARLKSLGLTN
tara:strand:- start:190 stop:609 length:420 start_codon:yes stop_codon:yes gene_type:complete